MGDDSMAQGRRPPGFRFWLCHLLFGDLGKVTPTPMPQVPCPQKEGASQDSQGHRMH